MCLGVLNRTQKDNIDDQMLCDNDTKLHYIVYKNFIVVAMSLEQIPMFIDPTSHMHHCTCHTPLHMPYTNLHIRCYKQGMMSPVSTQY